MKYVSLLIALLLSCLLSCQTNKSVKKDLVTGLVTSGDGISCDDVFLSSGSVKINRNSFVYGEQFYLNFNSIRGFEKIQDRVFPGMRLVITDKKGDTIMHHPDLYNNKPGGYANLDPLLLRANITTGKPIHSGDKYTLFIKIWDKKGSGTYSAEMDFDVKVNDKIVINNNSISYKEIYLFSSKTKSTIVDNNVKFNENIYFIFEELEGFYKEAGKSFIGIRMLAKDVGGNIIVDEKDLLADSKVEVAALKKLAPNFIFSTASIKGPISCEVLIWDKKSDHKIQAKTTLNIK